MDFTNKYTTAYIGVFSYAMWYGVKETTNILLEESAAYYDADFHGFDPSNPPFEAWGANVRGFYSIFGFIKAGQYLSFLLATLCLMAHLKVNYKVLQALVIGKFGLDLWSLWELNQVLSSWPAASKSTLELLSSLALPRFYFTTGLGGALFAVLFIFEFVNLCQQAYGNALVLMGKKAEEEQEKKDQ
ncbi:hypothetical protein Unana1_07856 [Umbelopsis nana]